MVKIFNESIAVSKTSTILQQNVFNNFHHRKTTTALGFPLLFILTNEFFIAAITAQCYFFAEFSLAQGYKYRAPIENRTYCSVVLSNSLTITQCGVFRENFSLTLQLYFTWALPPRTTYFRLPSLLQLSTMQQQVSTQCGSNSLCE